MPEGEHVAEPGCVVEVVELVVVVGSLVLVVDEVVVVVAVAGVVLVVVVPAHSSFRCGPPLTWAAQKRPFQVTPLWRSSTAAGAANSAVTVDPLPSLTLSPPAFTVSSPPVPSRLPLPSPTVPCTFTI